MSRTLPILFNTEVVRAILDGRKTVTRRIPAASIRDKWEGYSEYMRLLAAPGSINLMENEFYSLYPPYQRGDILNVRETWCYHKNAKNLWYGYRADGDFRDVDLKWRPSIHMPKEAARIFLRVIDVRVERLQNITEEQAQKEGCNSGLLTGPCSARGQFEELWNSTIKRSDRDVYSWKANPWVWVIEFERCEKPEEW